MIKKTNHSLDKVKKELKTKSILFAMWDCDNPNNYLFQNWYLPMKSIFGKVILFDSKKKNIEYGSSLMKEKLIELVKQEKPDFILFSVWGCGEFESIDFLKKFKEVSPNTKIIGLFGDDERDFDISSRYYAPFLDYNLVIQPHYVPSYIKEGNKAFPFYVIDTKNFKPLNLKKEYDVSFIGTPSQNRVELITFLINNGIKVSIWGRGWLAYPQFNEFYKGILNNKEFNEIISKTKINLGFSQNVEGEPHFKARILEFGVCKSFTLVSYFQGYLNYFKNNKEIVMFKDKNDLLKKIKYYLIHESEREKIAENTYKKIINKMDFDSELLRVFQKILDSRSKPKDFSNLIRRSIRITNQDMQKSFKFVKEKIKGKDYIILCSENSVYHKYRDILQAYSLNVTGKKISCCDYYVHSENLGNYLRFRSFYAYRALNNSAFNKFLNINQLAVTNEFFLNNLKKFKDFFEGKELKFLNKDNTAFVDIPLTTINHLTKNSRKEMNALEAKDLDKAFQLCFVVKLYSLFYKNKVNFGLYLSSLIAQSMLRNERVIVSYLLKSFFNKENWSKLKDL